MTNDCNIRQPMSFIPSPVSTGGSSARKAAESGGAVIRDVSSSFCRFFNTLSSEAGEAEGAWPANEALWRAYFSSPPLLSHSPLHLAHLSLSASFGSVGCVQG